MAAAHASRQIPGAAALDGMSMDQFRLLLTAYNRRATGSRLELIKKVCALKTEMNLSFGQLMCVTVLLQHGIPFSREHKMEITGFGTQWYDFWLPKRKTIIEYHGVHHFDPESRKQAQSYLDKIQQMDVAKVQYALDQGWKVILIDDTHSSIKSIAEQIMKGLKTKANIYLSDQTKLEYITDGLRP